MCDHIQPTFASFIQEVCKPRLCATYLCNKFVQHTVNQASRSAGEGGRGVAGPSGASLGMRIAGSDCNFTKTMLTMLTKTVSQKNYLELVACCVPLL